jgi:iron uptake system EfeUOB component EfeO/EfeM
MKLFNYISLAVIVSSIALSGCTKSETKETATPVTSAATSIDPQTGIKSMLDASALFNKAVDAKDAAQVKIIGPQFEEAWASFEVIIKANYPDAYLKVENSLSPLIIGAKQDTADFAILSKLNEALQATLTQLSANFVDGTKAVDSKALENSPELQTAAKAYISYVNLRPVRSLFA